MRRTIFTVVLAASAVMLSGCVGAATPFDQARTADDTVPPVAVKYIENADINSSRYQGDADGHALYLLRGTGEMKACLVYTDGTADGSFASCSGGGWLKVSPSDGAEFVVQLSGFSDQPGAGEVQVSPWVRQTRQGRDE
ncbi:hypothetical protein A0130_02610 [Leifsonia xyli]|uniref:hypothetical protein n=1 Tax=Leifsonia xyli TaxID=1575 RepID=UPI0007CDAECD|nr:hypothetical protein A0130_02610 [Leifsonia xyli]